MHYTGSQGPVVQFRLSDPTFSILSSQIMILVKQNDPDKVKVCLHLPLRVKDDQGLVHYRKKIWLLDETRTENLLLRMRIYSVTD